MEGHKKKKLAHWRDFLKEVGIIVLGVAIALIADGIVQWFHWRSMVADARTDIRGELQEHALNALNWKIRGQCFGRQLDSVEKKLATIKDGEPTPVLKIRFNTTFQPWANAAWVSASNAQVLTHMPMVERLRYALLYEQIDQMRGAQTVSFDGQATLWTLTGPPRPLTADLRQQVLQAIDHERAYIFYEMTFARNVVAMTDKLGIKPDPAEYAWRKPAIMACPSLL